MQGTPRQRLTTPTGTEVLELGRSIGINNLVITPGYERWWNLLHEIAHFAVKPDSYINLWREQGGMGVPYMNWFTKDGIFKPDDPTPDEWGVRAWCLLVLQWKGWVNPLECDRWHATAPDFRQHNNPNQWMLSKVISPSHKFYRNGFEQLEAVGINVKQGILRPTKELVTIAWQPVLGWQACQVQVVESASYVF